MKEMRTTQDDAFVIEAKRVLDHSAADLDQSQTMRLQRARVQILDRPMRPQPWATWASGLVLASIAGLALVFLVNRTESPSQHHPLLEDLELMTSTENVELSEDLEFYDWLAETAATTG